MAVQLDGSRLSLDDLRRVANGRERAEITDGAWARVASCAETLHRMANSGRQLYGITTGFGAFADVAIPPEEAGRLQENLLISHAVGVGEPLPDEVVRSAMLLRINTLLQGHSGITVGPLRLMLELLNRRLHPLVPSQGSVGASGDLAPLSHMALPLLGRGFLRKGDIVRPAAEVLEAEGLQPLRLTFKEGLALNNGTQVTTSLAVVAVFRALELMDVADVAMALSAEALCARKAAFDARIHALRPHVGQVAVARNICALLEGSTLVDRDPAGVPGKRTLPQDSYSIRCAPQIHGAARDGIAYVTSVLELETQAVTDNPLVFPDSEEVLSGGNFHGQPVAMAADHLKLAVATLGNVSERRVAKLLDPSQNEGLPAFLIGEPGLNSGLMITQYTAAALASENKTLAHPASVDTIPTSANTEDHVSMGPIAARHAVAMATNVRRILAIELLAGAQAIDLRLQQLGLGVDALGVGSRAAYEALRAQVDFADADRDFGADIQAVDELLVQRALMPFVRDALRRQDLTN